MRMGGHQARDAMGLLVYLVEDSGGWSVSRSMTHLDMGTKQRTNLEREPDVACCTMRLPSGYTRLPVRSEGNAKERAGEERRCHFPVVIHCEVLSLVCWLLLGVLGFFLLFTHFGHPTYILTYLHTSYGEREEIDAAVTC